MTPLPAIDSASLLGARSRTASIVSPLDSTALPADVRAGTKADRDRYVAALGFERQLVTQLAKQPADTAKADDAGSPAATQTYRQMLPDALADAVTQSGGLGLARGIYDATKPPGASA